MKVTLLNDFPRSMGHPNQDCIAFTAKQRDEYIKKYIKRANLYISVYKYTEIKPNGQFVKQSAFIDKVFFDFDSDSWLEDLRKLHYWCKKRNILHRCHCSGRGGHFFIFIKPKAFKNKQHTIGNFQRYICDNLELNIDRQIIGDTARIFRYPNTYNFKAKRWCIPLSKEVIEHSNTTEEVIFNIAKNQQLNTNAWIGSDLLDISEFDTEDILYTTEDELNIMNMEIDEKIELNFPKFPPCVKSWLSTPDLRDEAKYHLIIYLRDQFEYLHFTAESIIGILKKSLSENEFRHYFYNKRLRNHRGHQGEKFVSIMKNSQYMMASCEQLKKKGLCNFGNICDRVNPIYEM